MMDGARWERIQAIFHEVADLPGPRQHARLKELSGGDSGLQADVEVLLAEDARGTSLLDRDLAQIAHQMLENPAGEPAFRQFGPYHVKQVLGEGGMGVVYLAERKDLDSLVAIKILRDAWLSPARRERFAAEQRTLAQLNHPSIARLYDADVLSDGTPCFVMEYVDGLPITDYCEQRGSTMEERLKLFRAVCEAVQYAHQHAVIHRDLKPSNILAKPDGTVRLLDFGIAKQLDDGALGQAAVDQTMTGLRLMTPAYAAPEQVRGEQVGIHTDVYSLGVILYQLLTGKLPFDLSNRTPAEAETMITQQSPEKPSSVRQHLPAVPEHSRVSKTSWGDLDVLCLTAMHKDPQRRYRSAEALIRDVDHYLDGEPLEARPDSLTYRLGKFIRRNQRAVAATAMVCALLVGLVVFFTVRLARARNAALAEAARTQRVQHFMTDLFQGGDEAAGPADSLRVVTLLDRGVQDARSLSAVPEVQAELYQNLGGIYQKLGKFDQSDSLLNAALEERKKNFGSDSPQVAETLVALGLLRADQSKLDEAELLVREGLAMGRRHLAPDHPLVAKATFAVGKVLEDRGSYDQAIQILDQAVEMQSRSGAATADLAASLSELANSHFYAGHYDTSESLNQRILQLQRQLYGEHHPLVADTLINLGSIEFQRGHYAQDERYMRQALDIVEAWYGKDHPETADTMTILGQSLTYQQRFDEAAALLRESLAIQEKVYGPVHPRVAFALNELGNVAVRQGKLDDAEKYFSRVITIYRTVYHDKHYQISIAISNLAGVYVKRKQYSRAEALFRDALQRYTHVLAPDHLNVGIAHVRLGNTLVNERRYAEAEVETRVGYEILVKKTSSSVVWLKTARQDLATEYEALKQPDKAARFRAELAEADHATAAPVVK